MTDLKYLRRFTDEFKRWIVELRNAGKSVSEIMVWALSLRAPHRRARLGTKNGIRRFMGGLWLSYSIQAISLWHLR